LIIALIAVAILVAMVAVVMQLSVSSKQQVEAARQDTRAFYLAEAGVTEALANFETTSATGGKVPAEIGTHEAPRRLNGGIYWVEITANVDGTWTITSHGEANGSTHALQAIVDTVGSPVFEHALFAGNSSGDPTYTLGLSGVAAQGDKVTGDVYSGGDVTISGNAGVTGTVRALGSISGGSGGEEGNSQPIPDLAGMDYANECDYDVKKEFDSGGATYKSNSLGGDAWQLPESNPAHIFRKNPTDRASDTAKTAKDDYFLEDPYEAVHTDAASTGADACPITLSGTPGEPGADANQKIFYVDGNLWVHNRYTMSFKLLGDPSTGAQVTFVVKGNVYFSDNLFYRDTSKDAVLFVALKDSSVADSGNIYFGDPSFGTLEEMHSFMYAENDFIDYNLNASGSAKVRVYGNMSAGNQVRITRDYKSGGTIQHSRLTVDLDTRILDGSLDLPGLPSSGEGTPAGYAVVSWRPVPRVSIRSNGSFPRIPRRRPSSAWGRCSSPRAESFPRTVEAREPASDDAQLKLVTSVLGEPDEGDPSAAEGSRQAGAHRRAPHSNDLRHPRRPHRPQCVEQAGHGRRQAPTPRLAFRDFPPRSAREFPARSRRSQLA
jgi:hypothetical protein